MLPLSILVNIKNRQNKLAVNCSRVPKNWVNLLENIGLV